MLHPRPRPRIDARAGLVSLACVLGGSWGLAGCGAKKEGPAADLGPGPGADEVADPPALPEVAADPDAPAEPASFCDQVRALQGNWLLTTSVVGARTQAAVGTTVAYELAVTAQDCKAKAQLRRAGGPGAEAELAAAEGLGQGLAHAAAGTFALTHGEGAQGEQRFAFVVRGDQLFGYWHDIGPQWDEAGLSGVLTGARGEAKPALAESVAASIAAQPCPVRCVVGCDSARRQADATFVAADLDACIAGCEAPDAPAVCGEAPGLPEAQALKLQGPLTNLGQHCNVFLDEAIERLQAHPDELEFGCKSTIEFGGKESTALKADAFGASFEVARFFETGHNYQGYSGEVRLALMTKAGWFVSDPLLDSSAAGLQEHAFENLDLYARELADAPGKEVVAVLANRVTQPNPEDGTAKLDALTMTVACRAGEGEKGTPHCVALRSRRRSAKQKIDQEASKPQEDERGGLDVTFLPGGRVSIGAGKVGAGAKPDPLVGIWSW